MNNVVQFNNHNVDIITHNGQTWMASPQIVDALGMADRRGVSNIYVRHKDEFDERMTCILKTRVQGQLHNTRLFNREGAWLIGMFARTPKAVEFRKWVLKVLGNVADSTNKPVVVQEHTRSLPTGKKEIVLSDKAKTEIGGIVKSCLGGFQARINEKDLANRIVGLVTSYNFLAQHDKLMREASELRYKADLREQQARSFVDASRKIEQEVA